MRTLIAATLFILVFGGAFLADVFADPSVPPQPVPPTAVQPDVASLQNQLTEIGCNAERAAAAQEIVRLRNENAKLQKEAADSKTSRK